MSEQDNKMNINSSGGRLNAGAAAFVPGNYDSKPAATSTTKSTIHNGNGGPKGGPNRSGSGYRNNNRNYNNGGMMQGGYYQQAPYGMNAEQQMYIYQMQQLALAQGCVYDPVSNMMYNPATQMMYVIAPEYMVDPSQYGADYVAGTEQVVAEEPTEETGVVTEETGVVTETAEGTTEEVEVKTETETKEEAPTAPVVAKYVPPTRSTTTTTTPVVAEVDTVTDKLSGLTIEADGDNEEPVDIESTPTGEVRRYTKNLIVSLYSNENTVIPAELESYYKPAEYTQGCVDGKPFCRAPLGSILALAEAGVAFGGRDSQGGRNNKSSHNLRGGNSSSNLERSGSNNNFGRRNRNDKDREPGELVEGDEGFVPYEGNADDNAPRERTSKKNKNTTPAVYKSRFVLDASDPLAIVRKANGILNKLSITNFDKLSEEFLQMMVTDITTVDQLHKSVEALVTKAQMEENFCFIYADLCRKIIDQWEDLEPETGIFMNPPPTATTTTTAGTTTVDATTAGTTTASTGDSTEEQQTETTTTPTTTTVVLTEEQKNNLRAMGKVFKDALLSRCQTEFEFDHISVLQEIRDNTEFSSEEKTEKEILLKKRITGHMRFIGELYMKDLITANIMKKHCLEVLLKSIVEEELVCLCKLFQTVGAKIEKYHLDKSRQKKYKDANMQDVVPRYFETIASIGETHPSSRVRFMMKDLVDMRLNDWTARREEEKMINLDKKNTPSAADFAPVSGDARSMAAPADEWLVVPSTGRTKKTGGFGSGAPSPVPGGMSRSGSNTNFSRSANASGNNLTGLDRRAPRGPSGAGSSGVAGGLKKEKSGSRGDSRGPSRENSSRQARGSSRGASASPVPTKDDEGAATATTTTGAETATTEVLPYSTDLADIQKRVRSAMKEYYTNGLIEEPSLTFQELRPSPTLMPDIVKDMISQAVETSSEKSCTALCALLQALRALTLPGLPSTTTVLAVEDVKEAVFRFLNNFDDVLIDAPKAGTLGAVIVAQLCLQQALSLELFGCLPEDNEFAFSSKFAEFVVQVLAALSSLAGAERAEELYKQSQFDLLKVINAPPKETPEEVLRALAKKHNVTFLA